MFCKCLDIKDNEAQNNVVFAMNIKIPPNDTSTTGSRPVQWEEGYASAKDIYLCAFLSVRSPSDNCVEPSRGIVTKRIFNDYLLIVVYHQV